MLKRSSHAPRQVPEVVSIGDAEVDFARLRVRRGKQWHSLTSQEASLLQYLLRNSDRIVSREELLANVWGYSSATETRTIDAFIGRLRKKLEADAAAPQRLLSVRGIGYFLKLSEEPDE